VAESPYTLHTCSRSSTPVPFLADTLTMGVVPPHSSGTRPSSSRPCLQG
jgi:hypothetical protein